MKRQLETTDQPPVLRRIVLRFPEESIVRSRLKVSRFTRFLNLVVEHFIFLLKKLCFDHFSLNFFLNDPNNPDTKVMNNLLENFLFFRHSDNKNSNNNDNPDPNQSFNFPIIKDCWHFQRLFRFSYGLLAFFPLNQAFHDIFIFSSLDDSLLKNSILPILGDFLIFFKFLCFPFHLYKTLNIIPDSRRIAFIKTFQFFYQERNVFSEFLYNLFSTIDELTDFLHWDSFPIRPEFPLLCRSYDFLDGSSGFSSLDIFSYDFHHNIFDFSDSLYPKDWVHDDHNHTVITTLSQGSSDSHDSIFD